jgi:hypothetical protein
LLGLARDPDARVALAIVPLLLLRPERAEAIPAVAKQLEGDAKLMFECYCTEAHWLQRQCEKPLTDLVGELKPFPDWFSAKLELTSSENEAACALEALGKRQQALSHERLNWRGTYKHPAQSLMKQLTWERVWQI